MTRSMTGFGRGEAQEGGDIFSVEVKSVNNRYCDTYIRMPKQLSFLEEKVREFVIKNIARGKIDVFINYENIDEDSKEIIYEAPLAKAYMKALEDIRDEFELDDDISVSLLSGYPGILKVKKAEQDEEMLWRVLQTALDKAILELIAMRGEEGAKLQANIIEKIDSIENLMKKIEERAPDIVIEYKHKLNARITELLDKKTPDEARLAMEVALFADRCSIDEEIVRMSSHISQVRKTLTLKEPVGRKLDFLVQEMNREVNTIGSKANDSAVTEFVVDLKCELEKIREQIQNIE